MAHLSETRWGSPDAPKLAVLLHGLTSASPSWFRVAQGLVDNGYYVVAPDLIGHGHGARAQDYTIPSFIQHLEPHLDALPPLDLLVGHSLGGVIAARLPARYKAKQGFRMVLLDPPMEMDPETVVEVRREVVKEVRSPLTVEQYLEANPSWTRQDAAIKVLGAHLCPPEAAEAICDQGLPWSHTRFLLPSSASDSPSPPSIETIILGADPSKGAAFSLAEAKALATSRPDIKTAFVAGASHSIHREAVDVVVGVLLTGSVKGERLLAPEDITVEGGDIKPEQM